MSPSESGAQTLSIRRNGLHKTSDSEMTDPAIDSHISPTIPRIGRSPSLRTRPNQSPVGPRTQLRPLSSCARTVSSRNSAAYYASEPSSASFATSTFFDSPARPDSKVLPAISERPMPNPLFVLPNSTTPLPPPYPLRVTLKAKPKMTTFTPPPPVKFDSVPVPWKNLSLEAALCGSSSVYARNRLHRDR